MTCRRGGSAASISYTESEKEIHKYVGTPVRMDGGYYYPAAQVNAGVALLIGMLNSARKD